MRPLKRLDGHGGCYVPKQPDEPGPPQDLLPNLLARLQRIEGQVRGLARMVEQRRSPAEVLQQLASVQAALKGVTTAVLGSYLVRYAPGGVQSADTSAIDELMEVIYNFAS